MCDHETDETDTALYYIHKLLHKPTSSKKASELIGMLLFQFYGVSQCSILNKLVGTMRQTLT